MLNSKNFRRHAAVAGLALGFLISLAIAPSPVAASAQTDSLGMNVNQSAVTPGGTRAFVPNTLYAVEITCRSLAPFPSTQQGFFDRVFSSTQKTLTHFVVVTPTQLSSVADPNSASSATAAATAVAFAYSIDETKGQTIDNVSRGGCNQQVLIASPQALYLVPVASYTETQVPSQISSLFSDLTSAITSITPVITSGGLGQNVSQRLSSANSAASPIAALVALFKPNVSDNSQQQIPLADGARVTVRTTYSEITVNVRRVDSVVTDANPQYRLDLENAVKTAGVIDATKLAGSCQILAGKLDQAGFRSKADQAFGIVWAATTVVSSKSDLYTCLGDFADVAVDPANSAIWQNVPSNLVLTKDDVEAMRGDDQVVLQPSWSSEVGFMHNFTDAISVYAKSNPPFGALTAKNQRFVASDVTIQDPNGVFGNNPIPKGCPALFAFLAANGYYHYGFYGPLPGTSDQYQAYHAIGGLVAFKAAVQDSSAPLSHAIALLPIFNNRRIAYFKVTNDADDIKVILANRTNSNGFSIIDDTQNKTSSPAAATTAPAGTSPTTASTTTPSPSNTVTPTTPVNAAH